MQILKYQSEHKETWDVFVHSSRNGTFLFCRDFMEYHADRFADCSLLCYDKGELIALLPANIVGDTLYSHQGLTYGGFILSEKTRAEKVLDMFTLLKDFLCEQGLKRLVYKPVPHIYHRYPAEEDLYALFRNNAALISRLIASTIELNRKVKYNRLRIRVINKAVRLGIKIQENNKLRDFWNVLEANLFAKHQVKPVHSLEEISYLKSKFPDKIRLFVAIKDGRTLAGSLIFETEQVAHVQYISANDEGRQSGALDLLFDRLINDVFGHKRYFDFGTSTEDAGRYLNTGLISQKEGFGGRGIVYDCYKLEVND